MTGVQAALSALPVAVLLGRDGRRACTWRVVTHETARPGCSAAYSQTVTSATPPTPCTRRAQGHVRKALPAMAAASGTARWSCGGTIGAPIASTSSQLSGDVAIAVARCGSVPERCCHGWRGRRDRLRRIDHAIAFSHPAWGRATLRSRLEGVRQSVAIALHLRRPPAGIGARPRRARTADRDGISDQPPPRSSPRGAAPRSRPQESPFEQRAHERRRAAKVASVCIVAPQERRADVGRSWCDLIVQRREARLPSSHAAGQSRPCARAAPARQAGGQIALWSLRQRRLPSCERRWRASDDAADITVAARSRPGPGAPVMWRYHQAQNRQSGHTMRAGRALQPVDGRPA
jgi:hypothetical protein